MNDNRWLTIREAIGRGRLKNLSMIDLGCQTGDLVAAAAADGVYAVGVDRDAFVILEAQALWDHLPNANFVMASVETTLEIVQRRFDITLFLLIWDDLVADYGVNRTWSILRNIKRYSKVLFFEVQLYSGGAGVSSFKSKKDVIHMLSFLGDVKELTSFLQADGPSRTIFMVV